MSTEEEQGRSQVTSAVCKSKNSDSTVETEHLDMLAEKDFSGQCMSCEGETKVLASESPSGSFCGGQCGETEGLRMWRRRSAGQLAAGCGLLGLPLGTGGEDSQIDSHPGITLRNHSERARGLLGLVLERGLILRHLDGD